MERCLNYPDPPGVIWAREGVEAYCRYLLQPVISLSELKTLIDAGNAQEVDRRLTEWAGQPQSHPEAFWRMVVKDFLGTSPEVRKLLEAWKQQSPKSAFAFAASGYNFVQAAAEARGSESIDKTSDTQIRTMETLLARADGDLRMAIKLNPSIGVAYAAMIRIGTVNGDEVYVSDAVKKGGSAIEASLPVYDELTMHAEPRWGGNWNIQEDLLNQAQKHLVENPLLYMVRAIVWMDRADLADCYCRSPEDRSGYRSVFLQVAGRNELFVAGDNALQNHHYHLAIVYLSESLRFDRDNRKTRKERDEALKHVDPWLIER
jgi:hypothetical protein